MSSSGAKLDALGVPEPSDLHAVARHLRTLLGLRGESRHPELWIRLVENLPPRTASEHRPRDDRAVFAHGTVSGALAPDIDGPNGFAVWTEELGGDFEETDDTLRLFVMDELLPRLQRAGLIVLQ